MLQSGLIDPRRTQAVHTRAHPHNQTQILHVKAFQIVVNVYLNPLLCHKATTDKGGFQESLAPAPGKDIQTRLPPNSVVQRQGSLRRVCMSHTHTPRDTRQLFTITRDGLCCKRWGAESCLQVVYLSAHIKVYLPEMAYLHTGKKDPSNFFDSLFV